MKLFSLVLGLTALSSAALAADLPARKSPPELPVVFQPFSWTGFYVGANAGYADPNARIGITPGGSWVGDPDIAGVTSAATRNLRLQGFTGGAQAGYNYQVNNFVFGLEADLNGLNVNKSFASPVFAGVGGGTYSANGAVSLNYLATVRGRLGFAADHWLFFVTGGVAFTGEKFREAILFNNQTRILNLPLTGPAGGANAGSASKTSANWTLGGGVEYAFSQQWSAKAEYLYVKLSNLQFGSVYGPNNFTGNTYTIQHRARLSGLNVLRLGVNYHF